MIGRFTGAILGLLAFAVSILAGLFVQNSFTVILSRAIWALCIFSLLGLAIGAIAQFVINDFAKRRLEQRVPEAVTPPRREPSPGEQEPEPTAVPVDGSTGPEAKQAGT